MTIDEFNKVKYIIENVYKNGKGIVYEDITKFLRKDNPDEQQLEDLKQFILECDKRREEGYYKIIKKESTGRETVKENLHENEAKLMEQECGDKSVQQGKGDFIYAAQRNFTNIKEAVENNKKNIKDAEQFRKENNFHNTVIVNITKMFADASSEDIEINEQIIKYYADFAMELLQNKEEIKPEDTDDWHNR